MSARARDIKLPFEHATGARSQALARQGQTGERLNARPGNQAKRANRLTRL